MVHLMLLSLDFWLSHAMIIILVLVSNTNQLFDFILQSIHVIVICMIFTLLGLFGELMT